tara:strand:+ start:8206 stop:9342 length:1137 start_codon:yes stop_codon:yes gene_type:complete
MIKLPPPINIDSELRLLLSCLYLSVNKLAFLNGPTWQKSQILTSLTNGYYDIFRNDEIDDDQKGGSKQTVNLKDFDAYFETIALNNPNYSLNSWITPPDFPTHSIRGCSNKYVDFTSRRSSLISESVFAKKQGSCRTCSQDRNAWKPIDNMKYLKNTYNAARCIMNLDVSQSDSGFLLELEIGELNDRLRVTNLSLGSELKAVFLSTIGMVDNLVLRKVFSELVNERRFTSGELGSLMVSLKVERSSEQIELGSQQILSERGYLSQLPGRGNRDEQLSPSERRLNQVRGLFESVMKACDPRNYLSIFSLYQEKLVIESKDFETPWPVLYAECGSDIIQEIQVKNRTLRHKVFQDTLIKDFGKENSRIDLYIDPIRFWL